MLTPEQLEALQGYVSDVQQFLDRNPNRFHTTSPDCLTPVEFLQCYLNWHGISGYTGFIVDILRKSGWDPKGKV